MVPEGCIPDNILNVCFLDFLRNYIEYKLKNGCGTIYLNKVKYNFVFIAENIKIILLIRYNN